MAEVGPAGVVRVRLTIEGLRHTIEHAFLSHMDGIENVAKVELANAIENFDLQELVRDEINVQFRKVVRESVSNVIQEISAEMRERLVAVCNEAIQGMDDFGKGTT